MHTEHPLSIAIIGLGNQGKEHLDACLRNPHLVKLAAIIDPRYDSLNLPIQLPDGCKMFRKTQEVPPGLIQAAIVATPPSSYKELLPALMEQSIHLLIEKPLGMNLDEAAQLLDTAIRNHVVLMPSVQRRFHESYRDIQPVLHDKMGSITQAVFQLELDKMPDGWRKEQGMGCLIDLGFHALDLARDLFGDLHLLSSTVFDQEGHPCHSREDAAAHLLFQTESGTFLRIVIKRGAAEKLEHFDAKSATHQLMADRSGWKLYQQGELIQKMEYARHWESALDQQLADFIQASEANDHSSPGYSAKFGLITMKLLEEIYAKAAIA